MLSGLFKSSDFAVTLAFALTCLRNLYCAHLQAPLSPDCPDEHLLQWGRPSGFLTAWKDLEVNTSSASTKRLTDCLLGGRELKAEGQKSEIIEYLSYVFRFKGFKGDLPEVRN